MASTQTDRLTGLRASVAVKAACRAATTAGIALNDVQTIDGILLANGDRALVKDQTDATQNGIYLVKENADWQRASDFNSFNDFFKGTRVLVTDGTIAGGVEYSITSDGDLALDTSDIAFDRIAIAPIANLNDGSASTPSLPFASDANTGLYKAGDDLLGIAAGGQSSALFGPGGIATALTDAPTATGTANALVASTLAGIVLSDGTQVKVKAVSAITGASTLNIDATGIKPIRHQGDISVALGDIRAGGTYEFRYDAAYDSAAGAWLLLNPSDVRSVGRYVVSVVDTASGDPATDYQYGDVVDGITLAAGLTVLRASDGGHIDDGLYPAIASGAAVRDSRVQLYDDFPALEFMAQQGVAYRGSKWECTSLVGGTLDASALKFEQNSGWENYPIGTTVFIDSHISGVPVPPTDRFFRYVLLTAGEDGVGEYNEGIVTNESVSGSSPDIDATCEIDLSASPLDGQTIRLVNTEGRFFRASAAPGTLQDSQNLLHGHPYAYSTTNDFDGGNNGGPVIEDSGETTEVSYTGAPEFHTSGGRLIGGDGGDEARPRNIGKQCYMRIL